MKIQFRDHRKHGGQGEGRTTEMRSRVKGGGGEWPGLTEERIREVMLSKSEKII